jgi:hypothetical protein
MTMTADFTAAGRCSTRETVHWAWLMVSAASIARTTTLIAATGPTSRACGQREGSSPDSSSREQTPV